MSSVADSLFVAAYFCATCLLAVIFLASIVWSFIDARSRGKSGLVVAGVVALLAWPIGLIVWLLFRPRRIREIRPRFRMTPRFSLAVMLVFIAFVGVVLAVFVSTSDYHAQALIRVRRPAVLAFDQAYDYDAAVASVVGKLKSDELIRQAAREVIGNDRSDTVDDIKKRLDITNPSGSEVVSVSIRGRTFRDDKTLSMDLLNAIADICVKESTDDATRVTMIQLAIVP